MRLPSASCTEIVTNVNRHGYDQMYIGLNDIKIEGSFVWDDGTSINSGFSSWDCGQPYDNGNEDCVEIYREHTWNDASCYNQHIVWCERLV